MIPPYIQWTILIILYVASWNIPLVLKGLMKKNDRFDRTAVLGLGLEKDVARLPTFWWCAYIIYIGMSIDENLK